MDNLTDIEREWLARLKQTMAVDLARGMSHGMTPKALVEMLFKIPEVEEAMRARAKGKPKD